MLAAYVAGEKRRSGVAWLFLSLFFSPLFALLALAALPMGNTTAATRDEGPWRCSKPQGRETESVYANHVKREVAGVVLEEDFGEKT